MEIEGREVPFRLPIRAEAVLTILRERRKRGVRKGTVLEDQAERVAWRQVLRWVEAQLALVETGMVEAREVFLPYLQVGAGRTLFQEIESRGYNVPRLVMGKGSRDGEGS
jgi:hypothetical protein